MRSQRAILSFDFLCLSQFTLRWFLIKFSNRMRINFTWGATQEKYYVKREWMCKLWGVLKANDLTCESVVMNFLMVSFCQHLHKPYAAKFRKYTIEKWKNFAARNLFWKRLSLQWIRGFSSFVTIIIVYYAVDEPTGKWVEVSTKQLSQTISYTYHLLSCKICYPERETTLF